jgi:hypothetical protein
MESKYKLLDDDDVPVVSTISGADSSPESVSRRSARRVAVTLLLGSLTLACVLTAVYFTFCRKLFNNDPDFVKFQFPAKGSGDVMQEVYSSVADNYVQYYTEPSPTQRYWILDDFNTGLQLVRSEDGGQSICFVKILNKDEAVAPTAVQPKFVPYKEHSHGVFTPDEEPVDDKEFLGLTGRRLCRGVNVYWLRPMEDVIEVPDLSSNMSALTPLDHNMSGHRAKRNIRSCTTSCCWLVCCCDTHHFTWETAEHFTCMHICRHCTKAYKSKVNKIC